MEYFKPTFLYIKQHKITGLLYFGKTTRSEKYLVETYLGSGKYWNNHLEIHGKDHVETLWYCLFVEKDELVKFALICSTQWDIVNAKDATGKKIWANCKLENGLNGGAWNKGIPQTAAHRDKSAIAGKGRIDSTDVRRKRAMSNIGKHSSPKGPQSIEHKLKRSTSMLGKNKGRIHTDEHKAKNKATHPEGVPRKQVTCPHCNKIGGDGAMLRWHFNNCKNNNERR